MMFAPLPFFLIYSGSCSFNCKEWGGIVMLGSKDGVLILDVRGEVEIWDGWNILLLEEVGSDKADCDSKASIIEIQTWE